MGGVAGSGQGGDAGMSTSAGTAGSAGMAGSGGVSGVGRHLLMVGLSTGKPSAGDTIMINRLQGRGFEVMLVADTQVTAAAADGKDLILISSSEESGNLGTKLRDVTLPILCMEDGSFADMKMASARGHGTATTSLDFVSGTPLFAGSSGAVTIATPHTDADDMGWGTIGGKAIVAATMPQHPEQAALFGYEKGQDMVGMTAPARRVGFAAREPVASRLSDQGLQVFDAAINWLLGG
jgi:hypothetical protein